MANEILETLPPDKLKALAKGFGHSVTSAAAALDVLYKQPPEALAEALARSGVLDSANDKAEKGADSRLFKVVTKKTEEFGYNGKPHRCDPDVERCSVMESGIADYICEWLENNGKTFKRLVVKPSK